MVYFFCDELLTDEHEFSPRESTSLRADHIYHAMILFSMLATLTVMYSNNRYSYTTIYRSLGKE